jgi:hypothetical protein
MVSKFQSASICTDVINFVLSYLDFMFILYARPILKKSCVTGGGGGGWGRMTCTTTTKLAFIDGQTDDPT